MIWNFDPPETGWDLNAYATIIADGTAPTLPNVLHLNCGGTTDASCRRMITLLSNPTLVPGTVYPVYAWVNFDGMTAPGLPVRFYYEGTGLDVRLNRLVDDFGDPLPALGWERRFVGNWAYDFPGYRFYVLGISSSGSLGSIRVDEIEIVEPVVGEEDMAVMLSEFAVRAVLARAQSALNTEIGYVELEAAVGIDLPLVTGWRSYDPGLATPDVVEFETFETGDLTFPSETYDQSTWQAGQRTRVLCKVPMRVAINHANRGDADNADATLLASRMAERSRLYGAALVRCYRNDPTCGQTTTVTIVPRALRYNVRDTARITSTVRRAARVEFDFDVHLQETPTGETFAAGASLPSANLETP